MKKMFAASLVAIMAVSAANAEIASVSYTDKAIETKISAMDLASKGGADSFIQTVAQEDGTVTATATAFDSNINDTSTVAPQTKAIKSYVDNKFNTISDNNGSLITRMDTLEGRQNLAQDAIDALQVKDTELAGAITSGDSTTLNSAKAYTDTLANGAVADNTAAIAAINNETTGILAKAAADAASKDSALETKITDAYEAADATTLSDAKTYAKDYADGLAGNYATAAQGDKADSALQQADVTTGTANGTIKVKGTDVSVAGLGSAAYTDGSAYATAAQGAKADTAMQASELKGLPSWSSAGCATGTCSLVSKSGTIQWEAVRYAE